MLSARIDLQKQATGIVVGIARPKGDHIVAYGRMGLHDNRPVDGRTVFDIGSITKVFTALLLSDMARRHGVALDDPAGKYLPGIVLPARNGKQITLADLATHTSGLPLRPTNLSSTDAANPYAGYTRDALFAFLSSYRLSRDPGSAYEYSNVGFGLLGLALSAHDGKDYAELVRTRITGPLGMNDTRIEATDDMKRREAIGYNGELVPVPHWDEGVLDSAGAYRSTADDLLKLLDALLGFRKSALKPAMDAMVATRRPGGMPPADAIALAWNIYRDDEGHEIVWKNGSVGGFRAFIGYDRVARVGAVALANAQTGTGADDIGLHLLDPGFPVDLELPRKHTEIALAPSILDRFVGRYRYSATDVLTVMRKEDHLYIIVAQQGPIEVFAESPNSFFLKVVNAQLQFEGVKDGHATKAIWHQGGAPSQIGERVE